MKAYQVNPLEPLRIGYIPTILNSFLGEALHLFGLLYPQVSIDLQEMFPAQQVEALRKGKIDIAFMGNPPDELEAEFEVQCIKKVLIMALLPHTHALASKESLNLAELSSENFIGMSEATFPGRNDRIRDTCRCADFSPNFTLYADSHASLITLVGTGKGVTVMPEEAQSLPHPNVVFVPLHEPKYYARSTAVWKKGKLFKSLDDFLKVLFTLMIK
jgi:DNA-binding transcriptional LysR family regulator